MDPFDLVGTWGFRREIRHADGAEYAADGEAELVAQADGRIRWTEHGTLRWTEGTTPVTRTLFLVRTPASDEGSASGGRPPSGGEAAGWRVTFEDGRDFHPWTAGAVEHVCGPDLYRGGVAGGTASASWEVRWRVTGPEKDYTMHTWYSPSAGHARDGGA